MKTGFIGLGAMGLSMARNLHRAGLLAAVWNRSLDKARELAGETGCAVAEDPADLAGRCDVIVLCVSADGDVLDVVGALKPGLRSGHVVVDCSTVAASTAVDAAETVRQAGAAFLDCPVSGGTEGAAQGTLAIMCGGAAEALAQAMPALEAMGRRIVHMGPVGSGQATKAVNQIMVAGINEAVTEALAFGEAMDLPMDKVIEVVGSGAAGNWFLTNRGPTMVRGTYAPGFKMALHDKDLSICQKMAAEKGVQLPVIEMTRLHYRRLLEEGHGDEDISALHRAKQALFGDAQGA